MQKIEKLTWWQRLQCRWFCPNFKEDRPAVDEPGTWVACSVKVGSRGGERDVAEVEGLCNAYEVARWLALELDRKLPHADGLGVNWAIRRKNGEE